MQIQSPFWIGTKTPPLFQKTPTKEKSFTTTGLPITAVDLQLCFILKKKLKQQQKSD